MRIEPRSPKSQTPSLQAQDNTLLLQFHSNMDMSRQPTTAGKHALWLLPHYHHQAHYRSQDTRNTETELQ